MSGAWSGFSRIWVTLDRSDARSLLQDERIVYARGPTIRNLKNLLANLILAWGVVREVRPAVVVTTGAALAVPFAWIGKLHGARVVYIESFTRIERPSLSCRLVEPVADRIYVQWPELQTKLPSAHYAGSVFSAR